MKTKEYRKLHAEWYELASAQVDHSEEIDCLVNRIDESSEPILGLGSGTGRVLVPLMERGFDVYGIDTSKDMMARCRTICESKGLKAKLFEQSMVDFALPQKFGMIVLASGSLGLFTSDQDILSTFERVMHHLKPGGLFIFEFQPVPAEDNKNDNKWSGNWLKEPNDVVIAWRQMMEHNTEKHTWKQLFIIEKFVNGNLVETEVNERVGRYFTVDEAKYYAESTGFEDVKITNWLTEEPPSKDSKVITVRCKRPN